MPAPVHHDLEAKLVAVEADRGLDVVDDVADADAGHERLEATLGVSCLNGDAANRSASSSSWAAASSPPARGANDRSSARRNLGRDIHLSPKKNARDSRAWRCVGGLLGVDQAAGDRQRLAAARRCRCRAAARRGASATAAAELVAGSAGEAVGHAEAQREVVESDVCSCDAEHGQLADRSAGRRRLRAAARSARRPAGRATPVISSALRAIGSITTCTAAPARV
jgi:hypothetical protein